MAAQNSYQVSNRLKISDRPSGVPQQDKKLSISPSAHKRKKEGKWAETCFAPGARGHGREFAHGAAGLAARGETPPSCWCPPATLRTRARLSTSLVPSHTMLCHPPVWELESTSDPEVRCTCDSPLTK